MHNVVLTCFKHLPLLISKTMYFCGLSLGQSTIYTSCSGTYICLVVSIKYSNKLHMAEMLNSTNTRLGLPLTSSLLLEYSSEYLNEYSSTG